MHPNHRSFVKIHKFIGKYYYEILKGWALANAKRSNTGVIDDIHSEEEALEFALKLKACGSGHQPGGIPQHYYLLPNFSATEMALIFTGHHILHDVSTINQCQYFVADEAASGKYPFIKFRKISIV